MLLCGHWESREWRGRGRGPGERRILRKGKRAQLILWKVERKNRSY